MLISSHSVLYRIHQGLLHMSLCPICTLQEAKYKCPKCFSPYCSLKCFKSELHLARHESVAATENEDKSSTVQLDPTTQDKRSTAQDDTPAQTEPSAELAVSKFRSFSEDPIIQSMLKQPSLQFHLLTLIKILSDPQLTNESSTDGKRTIMNLKLNDLRSGGIDENELVEEFIERILVLEEEANTTVQ